MKLVPRLGMSAAAALLCLQANAQPAYLTFVPTPRTAPSTTPDFSLATFSASSPDGWELRFRTWPVTAQQ